MKEPEEQSLESAGLKVGFDFRGDRFGHEIRIADGPRWLVALRSIEDAPAAEWPMSPPLQSLHFESSDEHGRVALLVGMAGHAHWSASVRIQSGQMHFDIACRLRGDCSGTLESCYETSLPVSAHDERQAWLALPGTSNRALRVRLDDQWQQSRLTVIPSGLAVIASLPLTLPPGNHTVRWGYSVAVENAPGGVVTRDR
ncbi:MAG TPA: hypothetical protein VHV08_04435 [Pirellulales bacterium]|nr:hypothetical protein [Pirellulales bacterium]